VLCVTADVTEDPIAALVAEQHGVITRRQLLALGLGAGAIRHRLRSGRLHALYHGVYAVGHPRVGERGALFAAVLAIGGVDGSAAISHATAADRHGMRRSYSALTDLTATGAGGRGHHPGLRVFRHPGLARAEVVMLAGLPYTSPARTILDLTTIAGPAAVRFAFASMMRRRLATIAELESLLDRHRGRPGTPAIRALLDEHLRHGAPLLRSELEALLAELVERRGLPRPQINARPGSREIDVLWPDHRLVVELDSWVYHRGRRQFVRDRARNRAHVLAGFRVLAFTGDDLESARERVADEIELALASARRQVIA